MSKVTLSPPTAQDITELVATMRDADVIELGALGHTNLGEVVRESIQASGSMAFSVRVDGVLVCIFGVAALDLLQLCGGPWLLGSTALDKCAKQLLRESRRVMALLREDYPILINYVHVDNHRSLRWLRWLGFEIFPAQAYGPNRAMFRRFEMRTGNV